MRLAIVGGGVVGMTCAVALKTAFPSYHVTVFADSFSPETTGDGGAGLWGPYLLNETPIENVLRWAGCTHRWMEHLWKSGLGSETGVTLIPIYLLYNNLEEDRQPTWFELVYGTHKLTEHNLRVLNEEHGANYRDGWHYLTYTCEPVFLLPWLMDKFVGLGGSAHKRKINTLHELIAEKYELIINCSGLGARELVHDRTVTPIRGQVSRVKADWLSHACVVLDGDGHYVIPNINSVVLGGTHQEKDYDRSVRAEDSNFIHQGCYKMWPALKNAEILSEWVGLRPGRLRVRLESEVLRTPAGQKFVVVHNYGHGGAGVTLSWGCAMDVVNIVRNVQSFQSKCSKL